MPDIPEDLRLIGFLVLVSDQTGFLDPVFQNGDRRYIQRADGDLDRVAGFDEIALGFSVEPLADGVAVTRTSGDARLFAFRFPDGGLAFGTRPEMARLLKERFFDFQSEQEGADSGLLLLDVLSFLGADEAVAQEMRARTLACVVGGAGEPQGSRSASARLFQHGFCHAGPSGRITTAFDPGILCIRESDLRPTLEAGLRRLRSGRLVPVFCLALVTGATLLAGPLRPWHGLDDGQLHMLAEGATVLAILWLVFEVAILGGRIGRSGLAEWVVRRVRQMMAPR